MTHKSTGDNPLLMRNKIVIVFHWALSLCVWQPNVSWPKVQRKRWILRPRSLIRRDAQAYQWTYGARQRTTTFWESGCPPEVRKWRSGSAAKSVCEKCVGRQASDRDCGACTNLKVWTVIVLLCARTIQHPSADICRLGFGSEGQHHDATQFVSSTVLSVHCATGVIQIGWYQLVTATTNQWSLLLWKEGKSEHGSPASCRSQAWLEQKHLLRHPALPSTSWARCQLPPSSCAYDVLMKGPCDTNKKHMNGLHQIDVTRIHTTAVHLNEILTISRRRHSSFAVHHEARLIIKRALCIRDLHCGRGSSNDDATPNKRHTHTTKARRSATQRNTPDRIQKTSETPRPPATSPRNCWIVKSLSVRLHLRINVVALIQVNYIVVTGLSSVIWSPTIEIPSPCRSRWRRVVLCAWDVPTFQHVGICDPRGLETFRVSTQHFGGISQKWKTYWKEHYKQVHRVHNFFSRMESGCGSLIVLPILWLIPLFCYCCEFLYWRITFFVEPSWTHVKIRSDISFRSSFLSFADFSAWLNELVPYRLVRVLIFIFFIIIHFFESVVFGFLEIHSITVIHTTFPVCQKTPLTQIHIVNEYVWQTYSLRRNMF